MNIQEPAEITRLLQEAIEYHRAGQMQKAEQIYRRVLSMDPDNSDANHLLGLIASQFDRSDIGIRLIRKAIQVNPGSFGALLSLGNVLMSRGDTAGAIASYRNVINLEPGYAEAHNNLGNALASQGDLAAAAASYRQALAIKPDYAEAHNNLGNIYSSQDSLDAAIASYRQAIAIKPDYAEAYNNLGASLLNQGDPDGAAAALYKALTLSPDYAEAHNNLGNLHKGQGNLEGAVACYRRSLTLKPDNPEVHNNLGLTLMDKGDLTGAIENFRKTLVLQPHNAAAHSSLLFTLNYLPDCSQEEIFRESRKWGKQHAAPILNGEATYDNIVDSERRLKIGYVSPDFFAHSVANFIEPVIKSHNRENVEIFCYANVVRPDGVTKRIRGTADHWISIVGRSDAEVADSIRQDRIDILVDLAGHTGMNLLLVFARRPAPVQVSWLGYPNTSGIREIDYRLTDAIADPAGEADVLHTEELIRLQHGFLCFQADESAPAVAGLPCLQKGHVTFGSFNNLTKCSPQVVRVWAEILKTIPGSRILLKSKQLTDAETKERCLAMFLKEGVPEDRIELHGRLPRKEDHLALYNRVDIGLDPFPYNGTTTTCEALWMGVPVVTLLGDRHAGRVGASILHRVGLAELVAQSGGEYLKTAVALARDRDRLKDMRSGMRQRMLGSELMDRKLFTTALEDAYRGIWHTWCENR